MTSTDDTIILETIPASARPSKIPKPRSLSVRRSPTSAEAKAEPAKDKAAVELPRVLGSVQKAAASAQIAPKSRQRSVSLEKPKPKPAAKSQSLGQSTSQGRVQSTIVTRKTLASASKPQSQPSKSDRMPASREKIQAKSGHRSIESAEDNSSSSNIVMGDETDMNETAGAQEIDESEQMDEYTHLKSCENTDSDSETSENHSLNASASTKLPANPAQRSMKENIVANRRMSDPNTKKSSKPETATSKEIRYGSSANGNPVKLDMREWKKKNRIDDKTKVFMVHGPYPDARQLFLERGWIENTNPESPFYDFKWCLKGIDIDFKNLRKDQTVNHFPCATELTTKVGLCRNIRSVSWHEPIGSTSFFPICFDLGNCHERQDFIDEFRYIAAESVLKRFVTENKQGETAMSNIRILNFALNICQRRLNQLIQNHDDIDSDEPEPSAAQWNDLLQYSYLLNDMEIAQRKVKSKVTVLSNTAVRKINKKLAEMGPIEGATLALVQQASDIYAGLQEKSHQFALNGSHNIWIVKPAGKSRGRGIEVFNRLDKLMDYISVEGHFVAQKYMENPMILKNRKFDIRQWVLVTRWNPLTIFFYGDCYLRFTSTDFNIDNLEDKFSHLCNNSIQKYSDDFNSNSEIEGNMWSSDQFISHLMRVHGSEDVWYKKLQPAMKKIIISTLKCGQDTIENRKNTYEMYGFDLMLDDQMNPWLIEVNSSPTLEHCTPVTTRLCTNVVVDIMKLVVDNDEPNNTKRKTFNPEKTGLWEAPSDPSVDIGRWQLIYKGETAALPSSSSLTFTLVCEGKKITPSPHGETPRKKSNPSQNRSSS